jgi:hypothetical protein
MRLIRVADCLVMPWKNGGGATTQIAIHPEGASLDDFDWRISTAHVGTDGPFSLFPGIDRTLAVLAGAGIALEFGDGETMRLDPQSDPCAFAGERPVEGRLVAGPMDDLNVMTRRGRWRHEVRRLAGPASTRIEPAGDRLALVARSGSWMVAADWGRETLGPGDSVVLDRPQHATLVNDAGGDIFAIDLLDEVAG